MPISKIKFNWNGFLLAERIEPMTLAKILKVDYQRIRYTVTKGVVRLQMLKNLEKHFGKVNVNKFVTEA